jgi:hypothetical protein
MDCCWDEPSLATSLEIWWRTPPFAESLPQLHSHSILLCESQGHRDVEHSWDLGIHTVLKGGFTSVV